MTPRRFGVNKKIAVISIISLLTIFIGSDKSVSHEITFVPQNRRAGKAVLACPASFLGALADSKAVSTPLTDSKATFRPNDDGVTDFVEADFARKLEKLSQKLAEALRRTPYDECGESDHSGGHYHKSGNRCPIVDKAKMALKEFDELKP